MKYDENRMISENKTILDYIEDTEFQKVWRFIKKRYGFSKKRFRKAFVNVKNTKPVKCDRSIVVDYIFEHESLVKEKFADVYFTATKEESLTESFSPMTFSWEEFCSSSIIYHKKFCVYEMIAHFLYELTWYGYKPSMREKRIKRFMERLESNSKTNTFDKSEDK